MGTATAGTVTVGTTTEGTCQMAVWARRPCGPGDRGLWTRRMWAARMSGCTHGTPGPGIPCRGSRGYVLFLLHICYSCRYSESQCQE